MPAIFYSRKKQYEHARLQVAPLGLAIMWIRGGKLLFIGVSCLTISGDLIFLHFLGFQEPLMDLLFFLHKDAIKDPDCQSYRSHHTSDG